MEKEDPSLFVLCDVIGRPGLDNEWKTECFRVVGDHEKPLMLQSLWKPKEGFSRRFEIQKRSSVEAQSAKDTDNITAGIVRTQALRCFHNLSPDLCFTLQLMILTKCFCLDL